MNTRLAEVYKPRDELSVELPALMRECRDDYSPYDLPVEVDFLCAGIDTHDNCLFVEVVGFSKDGREHWGVEYFVAPYDLQSQGGIRDCLEMLASKIYYPHNYKLLKMPDSCESGIKMFSSKPLCFLKPYCASFASTKAMFFSIVKPSLLFGYSALIILYISRAFV